MKKSVRKVLDYWLRLFGIQTIRIYELNYLEEKYNSAVTELAEIFNDTEHINIPQNKNRITLLKKLYGTGISEALYILGYLHKSLILPGDVCEFGIANGATSALLANEIKNSHKRLWLFDSFQGLSKPGKKDKLINDVFNLKHMEKYENTMKYAESDVKEKLKDVSFPPSRTHIIAGFIEDTLKISQLLPHAVCFAYIDFDLYQPTISTLQFLDGQISTGGYIIVDDYNFLSQGVKTAVDEFVKKNKRKYKLILPKNYAGKFCILYRKI